MERTVPSADLVASLLPKRFVYIECYSCHRLEALRDIPRSDLVRWKFDFTGLRPSPLGVAKARCPACVRAENDFREFFREEQPNRGVGQARKSAGNS